MHHHKPGELSQKLLLSKKYKKNDFDIFTRDSEQFTASFAATTARRKTKVLHDRHGTAKILKIFEKQRFRASNWLKLELSVS